MSRTSLLAGVGVPFVAAALAFAAAGPPFRGTISLAGDRGGVAGARVLLFDLQTLAVRAQARTDVNGAFAFAPPPGAGDGPNSVGRLGANYPNPFNPSTFIPYSLAAAGPVRLEVFNLLGQRVRVLVEQVQLAGDYVVPWDGGDDRGRAVGAGVYLYRLVAGGRSTARRLVLVDGAVAAGSGAANGLSSAPAPTAADAVPAGVYGLTVSGPGIETLVDPHLNLAPGSPALDLVVHAPLRRAGAKVAVGGRWLGDVTADGLVDMADALVVATYGIDSTITPPNGGELGLGDVNADGRLNVSDALIIATYAAHPENPWLPAGIGLRLGGGVIGPVTGDTLTVELVSGAPATFVWIEPGVFTQGTAVTDSAALATEGLWTPTAGVEWPARPVALTHGFWLAATELTQAQWGAAMATAPWVGQPGTIEAPTQPAVWLSWDAANSLIGRLNAAGTAGQFRLPTEAEWEVAARAGRSGRWWFGNGADSLSEYAWYGANAGPPGALVAHAVATRTPNPWGLFDLPGNVAEWVVDWYAPYGGVADEDPAGPVSGAWRVSRGGSFCDPAGATRAGSRALVEPQTSSSVLGLRLVRRADPEFMNTPPQAEAGAAVASAVGMTITLDASGSADADGDSLRYFWLEEPSNPAIGLLRQPRAARPTLVPPVSGSYGFRLWVSDGRRLSPADSVRVTVAEAGEALVVWTYRTAGGVATETTAGTPLGDIAALGTTGVSAEVRPTPLSGGCRYDVRLMNRGAADHRHASLVVRVPRTGRDTTATIEGLAVAVPCAVAQWWESPPTGGAEKGALNGFAYAIRSRGVAVRYVPPATALYTWGGRSQGVVRVDGRAYVIPEFWERQPRRTTLYGFAVIDSAAERRIEVTDTEVVFTLYEGTEVLRAGEDVWDRVAVLTDSGTDSALVAAAKGLPDLDATARRAIATDYAITAQSLAGIDTEAERLLRRWDRWQGVSWDPAYGDPDPRFWFDTETNSTSTLFSLFARGSSFLVPQAGVYTWRTYGDMVWGDGTNQLHYDWIRAALKHYLRTGNRRALDWGLAASRHATSVDFLWPSLKYPEQTGMVFFQPGLSRYEKYYHGGTLTAAGEYEGYDADYTKTTHTWDEGLLLAWRLTGDPWFREAAQARAEGVWRAWGGATPADWNGHYQETRTVSWPLLILTRAYQEFGEPRYWTKAGQLYDQILAQEQRSGGRGFITNAAPRGPDGKCLYGLTDVAQTLMNLYSSRAMLEFADEARQRGEWTEARENLLLRYGTWLTTPPTRYGPYCPDGTFLSPPDTTVHFGSFAMMVVPEGRRGWYGDVELFTSNTISGSPPYYYLADKLYNEMATDLLAYLAVHHGGDADPTRRGNPGLFAPDDVLTPDETWDSLLRRTFGDGVDHGPHPDGVIGFLTNNYPGSESKAVGWMQLFGDRAAARLAGQPYP